MESKLRFSSGKGGLDAESGRPQPSKALPCDQIVRFATGRFLHDPKGFMSMGFLGVFFIDIYIVFPCQLSIIHHEQAGTLSNNSNC